MSETPTFTQNPTPEQEKTEGISEEYFQPIKDMQAARAAKETPMAEVAGDPFTSHAAERARSAGFTTGEKAVAVVAGVAAAAGAGIFGPEIVDRMNGPEFSSDKTTYTVEQGDGLQNAAEAVLGSENVDIRDVTEHIKTDPANIDALKDGLQPGESIVIPTSVEP